MVIFKLMDKIPFFSQFTLAEKELLVESEGLFINFNDGDLIIQQGAVEHCFYVLIKGTVAVSPGERPDQVLATLEEGAVFGEISYLTGRPRSTSVVAKGAVAVFRLDRQEVERMDPALQNKIKDRLIDVLVGHLDTMNDTLARLMQLAQGC